MRGLGGWLGGFLPWCPVAWLPNKNSLINQPSQLFGVYVCVCASPKLNGA